MALLEKRIALITGAANDIDPAHALSMVQEGAKILVNDLGGARDGSRKS